MAVDLLAERTHRRRAAAHRLDPADREPRTGDEPGPARSRAGALSDRIGGRPLLAAGLALQAVGLGWLAAVTSPTVPYITLVPAFVISGIGMSLFFAPVANVVLSSVRRDQEGIASGANNAIRELGGVFGIAVLGAVFSAHGSYASGSAFVSGLAPAVWVGAAAVAAAAAAALFLPRLRRAAPDSPAHERTRELELVG